MGYVLEVVKYITGKEDLITKDGRYQHVGYMKVKFETKEECCEYYDRHNPHMRRLNYLGTYISDWDPKTALLYIVREDFMLNASVAPFNQGHD
jgi:hypothetical protein